MKVQTGNEWLNLGGGGEGSVNHHLPSFQAPKAESSTVAFLGLPGTHGPLLNRKWTRRLTQQLSAFSHLEGKGVIGLLSLDLMY